MRAGAFGWRSGGAGLAWTWLLWTWLLVARAQAQPGEPSHQLHLLAAAGAGGQLHLTRDDTLDQGRVAPAFADARIAVLWPLGGLHVGPGLGGSVNLSDDGGFTEPVFRFQQWALMPAVWAATGLDGDLPMLVHLGAPLVLQGPTELPGRRDGVTVASAGIELGALAAYRLLAGVLAYAECDLNLWRSDTGSHLNGALSLGVMLDYEVLP